MVNQTFKLFSILGINEENASGRGHTLNVFAKCPEIEINGSASARSDTDVLT